MNFKKIAAAGGAAGLMTLSTVLTALAAPGYSLFDDAAIVSPGNASARAVRTTSDATPGWGGVDYVVPAGTTFADLQTLSTDYMFEADDSCGGGSPRFSIAVQDPNSPDTGNIFVYLGPGPNYTGCAANVWLNSGNLLTNANTVDTGQLDAGTFYDPYAAALVKYGDYLVTGVSLVTDGSWAMGDSEQTVFFDNTDVDGVLYTYELNLPTSKDQCKNGGYMALEDANGQPFMNQGQCVSYFNHM